MKSIKNLIISLAVGLTVTFTAAGAHAATLTVIGGQLHGATGVDVGGKLYDVKFVDGSCVNIFGLCDETSDFQFSSFTDARLASQALLDQVLINSTAGQFDSITNLTNGITSDIAGKVVTIWELLPNGNGVRTVYARNDPGLGMDGVEGSTSLRILYDLQTESQWVYARWDVSVVPLPAAFPLYGAGIAVLGFIGWRRKRKERTAV